MGYVEDSPHTAVRWATTPTLRFAYQSGLPHTQAVVLSPPPSSGSFFLLLPVSTESIYQEHSHPLHNEVDIVTLAKQPVDDFLQQGGGFNACGLLGFEETFMSK